LRSDKALRRARESTWLHSSTAGDRGLCLTDGKENLVHDNRDTIP